MRLNPEKNLKVRALLYVIGCGGLVHLTTLFIIAVTRQRASYFNPMYTVDVDQLWPGSQDNWFVYILGWIIFVLGVVVVYRALKKRNGDK